MERENFILTRSKNLFEKYSKYKKVILIGIGFFGVISITVFASKLNKTYTSTNEFQYDLGYYIENKYANEVQENKSILPMDDFKKNYFLSNDSNVSIISKSSYYLTQNDFTQNNISTKNMIAKSVYLKENKALIENNIKNVNPDKVAYLTFDDGPSQNTLEIMKILEKNNVKGNFFFIGPNMEENPNILKEVVEKGHTVGLHSYSHNYNKLYSTSEGLVEDFNKAQDVYESIIGSKTSIIRLPFGSKGTLDKLDVEALTTEGYKFWDWNVDSNDSNSIGKNKEGILKSIQKSIKSDSKKIVILMHEKNQTIESLDEMIKNLKESGYIIKPITSHTDAINYWDKK
ncbi:MAG: polysaccharide deacetylase [Romboutsia sp.]|nr:polysaccharide deacetylase [Romboutsia sp.]